MSTHDGQLQREDLDRKALGSRVLFHTPAEVGYRIDGHTSLSAYFKHMSNAYSVSLNEGMDRLGIRHGYRFKPPNTALLLASIARARACRRVAATPKNQDFPA